MKLIYNLCRAFKQCFFVFGVWRQGCVPGLTPFWTDGKGSLQNGCLPPKYFTLSMRSGRQGIMRKTKVSSYRDFGQTCYHVDYRFTGLYLDQLEGA